MLVLHGLSVFPQLGCAPLEHFSTLHQNGSLGVRNYIGRVHLHEIWLQPKASLTRTRATNDQNIFVSGGLWVLGAAVHCQALRFRQNHIVLEYRVDVGCNVLMGSP